MHDVGSEDFFDTLFSLLFLVVDCKYVLSTFGVFFNLFNF